MAEVVAVILALLVMLAMYHVFFVMPTLRDDFPLDDTPDHKFHPESTEPKTVALSRSAIQSVMQELPLAKVLHVIDGDTVIIQKSWGETRIRLDSIDCPEDGQDWGDVAKYGLVKLIGGKKVHVEEHGEDDYGRTLATLYVYNNDKEEWQNVNERMVTLGHAWVMRKYYGHLPKDRKNKLNQLENWAKSKKVGLWKKPNPIPPWAWRHND